MCGISGYFGKKEIAESVISQTLSSLSHRGPDASDSKIYKSDNLNYCYLLHNRLSIIDLDERSNQPITYKGLSLIFNGEIYNYVELRNQLITKGYKFQTKGDGEVFLKLIDCFGEKAYSMINGMWSAALYSAHSNSLTLSRDPFGEKPLYYFISKDGIYFSSEIKALEILSGEKFKFNYDKIKEFLVYGYKFMFKNQEEFLHQVQRVRSGGLLTINQDLQVFSKQHFNPEKSYSDDEFHQAKFKVRDHIARSLELRMRSDVPLAFCMSGGIDSNTLISTARNLLDYEVNTFTIVSKDHRYDEQEYVNKVCKDLKIKNFQIEMQKENFLQTYREIVQLHKHILPTISYFMHAELQKSLSNNGFKVSLSGTGADEIFSGYHDHYPFYLTDIRNKVYFKNEVDEWNKNLKMKVRNPLINNLDLFLEGNHREHIILNHEYFREFLLEPWEGDFYEEDFDNESILRHRMLNEMFYEIVPPILHADDLNAMRYSVENRSPFLDKDLFNYVNALPSDYLLSKGFTKYILRESMRGIVPEYILNNRRKIGFNLNINELLSSSRKEIIELFSSENEIYEIINKTKVIDFLKNDDFSKNSSSKFLFNLLSILFLMET